MRSVWAATLLASLLCGCSSVESGARNQEYAEFLRQRVIDTRTRAEGAESESEAIRWLDVHDRYANALNDYLLRRKQAAAMGASWVIGSQGNYRTPRHLPPPTCASQIVKGEIETSCY